MLNIAKQNQRKNEIIIDAMIQVLFNNLATSSFNYIEVVELIEANTKTLQLRTSEGNTFLHLVAGSTKTITGNIIKALLAANPDMLNAQNNLGQTPLMLACRELNYTVVETLMKLDAKVDIIDKDGKTVDDYATTPVMKDTILEINYPSRFEKNTSDKTKEETTKTTVSEIPLKAECLGASQEDNPSDQ